MYGKMLKPKHWAVSYHGYIAGDFALGAGLALLHIEGRNVGILVKRNAGVMAFAIPTVDALLDKSRELFHADAEPKMDPMDVLYRDNNDGRRRKILESLPGIKSCLLKVCDDSFLAIYDNEDDDFDNHELVQFTYTSSDKFSSRITFTKTIIGNVAGHMKHSEHTLRVESWAVSMDGQRVAVVFERCISCSFPKTYVIVRYVKNSHGTLVFHACVEMADVELSFPEVYFAPSGDDHRTIFVRFTEPDASSRCHRTIWKLFRIHETEMMLTEVHDNVHIAAAAQDILLSTGMTQWGGLDLVNKHCLQRGISPKTTYQYQVSSFLAMMNKYKNWRAITPPLYRHFMYAERSLQAMFPAQLQRCEDALVMVQISDVCVDVHVLIHRSLAHMSPLRISWMCACLRPICS